MPLPTQQQVHANVPLTNLVESFSQDAEGYAAEVVFPPLPVDHKSNIYYKWSRADLFRLAMKANAPGTPAEVGGQRLTTQTYTTNTFKVGWLSPDDVADNADAMVNLDLAGTLYIAEQAKLKREVDWVTAYFNTGLWDTDITGVDSGPSGPQVLRWNVSNSTPVEDILAGKSKVLSQTGKEPNVLVLGYQVKQALKTNAEILDRLKYGTTDRNIVTVQDSDLAALFEVKRVVTMKAIQTTSNEGAATDTFGFIGGKSALLAYAAPAPGIMVASAGYTFNWTGRSRPGGFVSPGGYQVRRFRLEDNAAYKLEGRVDFGYGLASTALGYFFTTIVD